MIQYLIIYFKKEASNVDKPLAISNMNKLMNQNIIENKKTQQGLDYFHLVKLSDTGNILNNFVNITPVETIIMKILQPLYPHAGEN